jgi:tRNA 2-selenouridine synthase
VPEALLDSMRASACVRLDAAQPLRVAMLEADYAHLVRDDTRLRSQLAPLAKLHGKTVVARWIAMAASGSARELAADLLEAHYDPSYERAIRRNFARYRNATALRVEDPTSAGFRAPPACSRCGSFRPGCAPSANIGVDAPIGARRFHAVRRIGDLRRHGGPEARRQRRARARAPAAREG